MGCSGSGKTTLLNVLSGKIECENLEIHGEIQVNTRPINVFDYESLTSYVMQDDIMEPTLTPLETLLFAAQLKLPFSHEEIEERVYCLIKDLNLFKCRNTRIGDETKRGISGKFHH